MASLGWISSTCFVLLGALSSRARAQDPDEPVHDGKWLYTRNCSGCHNDNGDGRGATILQLGLTARDFKQGGFAFGDTREQMIRTVSTGIPGRSPMPSFKGVLSDDEIGLVVDYVRTLMPPRKDEKPKNTIMVVRDKPVIARGKLPPLAEGGNDIPRGLLIGTPQGMTFEYDLEGVKLLGVRLGAFADREDWHDRGGGYLKPLGQLVWTADYDSDVFVVSQAGFSEYRPSGHLRHILGSTWVRDGAAGLSYYVRDHDGAGPPLLWSRETLHTVVLSSGPAFRREWAISLASGFEPVIRIAGRVDGAWAEVPNTNPPSSRWWRLHRDQSAEVVFLQTTQPMEAAAQDELGGRLDLACVDHPSGGALGVKATFVTVPHWSTELDEKLAKEILK